MEKAIVVGTDSMTNLNRELNNGWTVKSTERFIPCATGGSMYRENEGNILVILEKKREHIGNIGEEE